MAILVTGAAGFIALNVVEHLLRAGRTVVGLDRIPLPRRAQRLFPTLPGKLTMIGGSVLSDADLSRALTVAPVHTVIHCAVITAGARREVTDPETIVAVNVQGAVTMIMAAKRRGARKIIYPSSGAIYGSAAASVDLVDEDALIPSPVNLYGLTKRAAETILPRIATTQGLTYASARLGTVFGPWEYDTGVRDTLSPMLQVIACAQRGEEALLGPAWRGDYVYARDIADGLVRLAEAPNLTRTIYNLATGRATGADEFCRELARAVPGFRWRMAADGETPTVISFTGMHRGAFDISKISRETGYVPQYDFPRAARDIWAWFTPHPDEYD